MSYPVAMKVANIGGVPRTIERVPSAAVAAGRRRWRFGSATCGWRGSFPLRAPQLQSTVLGCGGGLAVVCEVDLT